MTNRTWLPMLMLAATLLYGCSQEPPAPPLAPKAPATPEAPVITKVEEIMPDPPRSVTSVTTPRDTLNKSSVLWHSTMPQGRQKCLG